MPNWKKVAVSGSAASFSSLSVDTSITASIVSSSQFIGNLSGTASYAISASYCPIPDQGFQFTQSVGSNTWTVNHGLNTYTPLVNVYDSSYNQLIPAGVTSISATTTQITFSTAQTGYAIISKGSGISSQNAISASYALTASYFSGSISNAESASYASTASYFSGSISDAVSASYALTASFASQSNTSISASYTLNSTSASYALSSSNARSSSFAATASHADIFTIGGSQMMYSNTPSTSAGNNGIFATSTGSFAGAFYQYTLYSGSNARSENANVVWTATTSSYTNYSTIDVGNTSGVVGSVVIAGGQIQLNILTPTAGWTIRAVATFI